MPEQSLQQTPDMQDTPDRIMQNNGEHNSAGPMGERPSENKPCNDILRQVPSQSVETSHSSRSINRDITFHANKNADKNGASNKPSSEHNAREHTNSPVRTRQLEQAQGTVNPQMPINDYGQLSSISQENMNQNRYFLRRYNCRQQDYSNSVNAVYQPQQGHLSSQSDQTQLSAADNKQSNYDHDGRRNERHYWTYVNGCRVRKDVDRSHVKNDSISNISPSSETSRPRATRPKADSSVTSQGLRNEFNYNFDCRNTSFIPGGKTVNEEKYKCVAENSKNHSFRRVHDSWDFSNKLEDLNREYRSTNKKQHLEVLLASNRTKHAAS